MVEQFNQSLIKPVTLVAGLLGCIQGILWTVLALCCVFCYYGVLPKPELPLNTTDYFQKIYFLYLYSEANTSSLPGRIINPKEFQIFMWIYLCLSFLWMICSACLIWAMRQNQWQILKNIIGLWAINAILLSILDLILTGLIGYDYKKLFDILYDSDDAPNLTYIGIVLAFAARGFVLWIMNVVFAGILIKFMLDIVQNIKTEAKSIDEPTPSTWRAKQPFSPAHWSSQPPPKTNMYDTTDNDNNSNIYSDIEYDSQIFENPRFSRGASLEDGAGRYPLGRLRAAPYIPEPDYDSPPSSPKRLKSVLRSISHY